MMKNDRKLQQFKQMAEADPDNELGHFSLGKAYMEAEQLGEAAISLSRAIELNPRMSKAYQLLTEVYDRAGEREQAVATATRGVQVADGQGDRVPRDALAGMLKEWGMPVPAFKSTDRPQGETGGSGAATANFACARCGRPSGQLAKPPFKGSIGEKVFNHVCTSCWREWIGMGTKVINELGLQLSSKAGQDAYDQYMVEFLQLDQL